MQIGESYSYIDLKKNVLISLQNKYDFWLERRGNSMRRIVGGALRSKHSPGLNTTAAINLTVASLTRGI